MEEGVHYIRVVMYISFISLRAYLQKEMALFDNQVMPARYCWHSIKATEREQRKLSKFCDRSRKIQCDMGITE